MKVIIHSSDIANDKALRDYVEHRIGFAFSRTRHFIRDITVGLADVNGPRGGVDQQCKVIVKPHDLQEVVIVERQSNISHAIDRSITRASRNFMQKMKRRNVLAKRRISHHSLQLNQDLA